MVLSPSLAIYPIWWTHGCHIGPPSSLKPMLLNASCPPTSTIAFKF